MRLTRKRFKPPERNRLTIRKLPDGREICMPNEAGRAEYKDRIRKMWQRQNGICPTCNEPLKLVEATFEHTTPRGMGAGSRNDVIEDAKGNPINAAVHRRCNWKRGSKRLGELPIPRGFDPERAVSSG